jgi:hypothetical protein
MYRATSVNFWIKKPIREANRVGFGFCKRRLWNARLIKKILTSEYVSRGYWDHFDNKRKPAFSLGIVEIPRVTAVHGLLFVLRHWCMLHAFWSITGLHRPKMGTFSLSHCNAAYWLQHPSCLTTNARLRCSFRRSILCMEE